MGEIQSGKNKISGTFTDEIEDILEGLFGDVRHDFERIALEVAGYVLQKYIEDEKSLLAFEERVEPVTRRVLDLLERGDYRSLKREFGMPPTLFRTKAPLFPSAKTRQK